MEVPMPIVTEAGDDAVVTAWFVADGDAVEEGQLIAEVQAEKVAQDVESPTAGMVEGCVEINHPVPQGDPICRVVPGVEGATAEPPAVGVVEARPERRPASPAARRVARERGVDLATVDGSGPGGRITEQDVLAAAGAASEASPMVGLRAVVARNMRRSHLETAPVTIGATAVIPDETSDHLTARVIRAVSGALGAHPELNGVRDGDAFVAANEAHICIAIQTDAGLVAPVLRDVSGAAPEEISDRIEVLAARAGAGALDAADYEGGTFTVSNLGAWGVEWFTPLINLPQVAILGVGAMRTVPAIHSDGSLVVAQRELPLSLTFDHAFVDGAPAAAFLADVVAGL